MPVRFGAIVILTLLSACSPVAVLNALSPRGGITRTHDIAYAAGARRSLDIYAPTNLLSAAPPPKGPSRTGLFIKGPSPAGPSGSWLATAASGAPVVVFIYGGGWKDGDKADYRFVAAALAVRGYLTVVPDYRLFPAVRFPVFIQDAAAAVAWTRNNIAHYGGDPHRIFLMGHSAGAQIAAMLTLDRQWLGAYGLDPGRDLAGLVGLAGPYDFLPLHDPELEAIFAPAGDLRLTQPITFAHGNAPPMFLAAGMDDTTVRPGNTRHLAEAIRDDGGEIDERLYPGIGHRLILGSIAGPLHWIAPVLRDVVSFLDQHVNRSAADLPTQTASSVVRTTADP